VPLPLGACLDASAPSQSRFPLFPFSAFVLAGTVTGATVGRQEPHRRHRRALGAGLLLLTAGFALARLLDQWVDFWGVSPAYVLIRLGGLLLILPLIEAWTAREWPGSRPVALLGRETLLVFVLHLQIIYGGVLASGPLSPLMGRLGLAEAGLTLALMIPVLYAAAWAWHRVKVRAPHEATLILAFMGTAFVLEFVRRAW
jgi:acyltransferase